MKLRYWRARLRLAGIVHRSGSTGGEWRCRVAEWLHPSYQHGMSATTHVPTTAGKMADAIRAALATPEAAGEERPCPVCHNMPGHSFDCPCRATTPAPTTEEPE